MGCSVCRPPLSLHSGPTSPNSSSTGRIHADFLPPKRRGGRVTPPCSAVGADIGVGCCPFLFVVEGFPTTTKTSIIIIALVHESQAKSAPKKNKMLRSIHDAERRSEWGVKPKPSCPQCCGGSLCTHEKTIKPLVAERQAEPSQVSTEQAKTNCFNSVLLFDRS